MPYRPLARRLQEHAAKGYHDFFALNNVSIEVKRGEAVGIIGRNGSGKSTLLQILAGTLRPTSGEVEVDGKVAALLELGSGFNPEFTGRENVYLNASILGLKKHEIDAKFDEIAAFADIGEFIEHPVKIYSSGMMVRLAFAVQTAVDPQILIVDEALAVGDIAFQAKCLERIRRLSDAGTTTILVTHDLATFQTLCSYGYLLGHGKLLAEGKPADVARHYYRTVREEETAKARGGSNGTPSPYATLPGEDNGASDTTDSRKAGHDGSPPASSLPRTRPGSPNADNQSGESRFGTMQARITDFVIVNADGEETGVLESGKPFGVAVRIEVSAPFNNLALGILFRNAQGQNLHGMHTYHENRYGFGPLKAGDVIEVTGEQEMRLNPGTYLLTLALADHSSDFDFTTLDARAGVKTVTVAGAAVAYGMVHSPASFNCLHINEIHS